MNRRLYSILLSVGLAVGLLAGAIGASAQDNDNDDPELADVLADGQASVLPWVPNGAELDGQGPFYGTVTVQNLEDEAVWVNVFVGIGEQGNNYDYVETVDLSPNESITLSADALDVPTDGASVVLVGWVEVDVVEEFEVLADPDEVAIENDVTITCGELAEDDGLQAAIDEGCEVVTETEVTGTEAAGANIAAVAKNVSPVASGDAATHSGHVTVDGYSGLTWDQITSDHNQFVLPIVQTNDGWDTTLRVANVDPEGDGLSNVTVTLYEAGGQGFGGESQVINRQLRPGGVESINLSDYVEEGWVGSAFITSSANIGAAAERHKAIDDMLVTNVSRPLAESDEETLAGTTTQYASLVFQQYNFWNTGISVANTSDSEWNQVTVTYYGPTGNNVGQDTLNIPPRGMEFIFTAGDQDLGLSEGFVGSAVLSGTQPFHAAVDQVKYLGQDADVGQAMSYIVAESPAFGPAEFEDDGDFFEYTGDSLALPLAQKGNPATGGGDTSGIQLFNTSADSSATVDVVFYSAAGQPVAPTIDNAGNENPISVTLSAHQSYTLYTHNLTEMSAGYLGSAIIDVTGGSGGVVGVSNNVNYDVAADGSAAFNLVPVWGEFVEADNNDG